MILENDVFSNPCKTDNPALKFFWEEMNAKVAELYDIPLSELFLYQQKANDALNYSI